MKEVFTTSFWQGVKKTFHEALEEPLPPADKASQTPTESDISASSSSTAPTPSVPSGTSGTTP
jgi:hypothetical protein